MKTEPAGAIGTTISAMLLAVFGILKASGVDVTEDMSGSITGLVMALIAVPAISGWLTRCFVWSPTSVQQEVNQAAATGSAKKIV